MSDLTLRFDSVTDPSPGPSHSVTPSTSSRRAIPTLTVFPNAFPDDPDTTGILPSILSRVKQTFAPSQPSKPERVTGVEPGAPQTEAQAIVEATKRAQAALVSPENGTGSLGRIQTDVDRATLAGPSSPRKASSTVVRPPVRPPSKPTSLGSSGNQSRPFPAIGRQWRPSAPTTAQVGITPVNSVAVSITATTSHPDIAASAAMPPPPPRPASRSHAREPDLQHQMYAKAGGPSRQRRESFATLPDSPSTYSLSAMVAQSSELTGAVAGTYMPGFPSEETPSTRSPGLSKRVQRYMRKMRGEGLSKEYWMADEQCKECYQCHAVRVFFSSLPPHSKID